MRDRATHLDGIVPDLGSDRIMELVSRGLVGPDQLGAAEIMEICAAVFAHVSCHRERVERSTRGTTLS